MDNGITAQTPAPFDRRAIPAEARESVWQAPDGHPIRRIDWPGRAGGARGSILFMPGRGDHYEKYLETLDQWHRAGWRVTAADWRGQGGSGRLGSDETTGHIEDFCQWIGDLAAFWRAWKADTPSPHVLSGHSMGGHLTLRAVAEHAVDPDALVLSAPMLGMAGPPLPIAALHAIARLMARIGGPTRPAWKWSEKPGEAPSARGDLLTHDADRYEDELWWRRERPEVSMGPGSWGWVAAAYASSRALFAPGVLEHATVPTLMIATTADELVPFGPIQRACARMPEARLVQFGQEARHEILREADRVRNKVMDEIARFLDAVAPAATP
ncbi:alpha/beta fold hydrolase [Qipengyuania sp.]|uniref:alpha/beta fold hydrolase n=1 Tax=Qipengyuania sp. TaxID=2004515 RepID=UPI0035C7C782